MMNSEFGRRLWALVTGARRSLAKDHDLLPRRRAPAPVDAGPEFRDGLQVEPGAAS